MVRVAMICPKIMKHFLACKSLKSCILSFFSNKNIVRIGTALQIVGHGPFAQFLSVFLHFLAIGLGLKASNSSCHMGSRRGRWKTKFWSLFFDKNHIFFSPQIILLLEYIYVHRFSTISLGITVACLTWCAASISFLCFF